MAQNLTTTLALLIWPIVALMLYVTRPAAQATLWTILGAQLLLPVGAALKIPGVPQFDKVTIGNIAALIGCLFFAKARLRFFSGFGIVEALILLFVIGPFVTSELNDDLINLVDGAMPPLGHYDGLSALGVQCLILIPFVLGRSLIGREESNGLILFTLVTAGLFYSIALLFEIRFSPQLHGWVYGYFPTDFYQEVRSGGFRPVVFMGNGLTASFFIMTTVVGAAAVWRTQPRFGNLPSGPIVGYLATTLVLCKSFGATLYAILLTPLVRFASPRTQIRIAVMLALFGLAYPVLRTLDFVPTRSMVDAAAIVDIERSLSLQTRFDQERQLLDRALQRPMFGWGRWGRSRIYNEDLNKDVSLTDGRWIITLGQYGIVGFVAEFGLLAISVIRSRAALAKVKSKQGQIFLAALALIVAINIIELLPNSTLMPWTFLVAGALLGRSENALLLSRRHSPKQRYLADQPASTQIAAGAFRHSAGSQPTAFHANDRRPL
jgi:hypothetical protein